MHAYNIEVTESDDDDERKSLSKYACTMAKYRLSMLHFVQGKKRTISIFHLYSVIALVDCAVFAILQIAFVLTKNN